MVLGKSGLSRLSEDADRASGSLATGQTYQRKLLVKSMPVLMDFEKGVKASDTQFHNLVYMSANFRTPIENLGNLLPTHKLQPIESEGKTEVRIFAFEYIKWGMKEQLLPPYNEWTLTIPVKYREENKTELDGFYVVWMPVTHEIPLRGGIEGWGFNKFMSDIRFTDTEDTRTCNVTMDGKQLISFIVRKTELSDLQEDLYVYNEMKGVLTRTLAQFKGDFGMSTGEGSGSMVLGDHPIAKQIASTDLKHASEKALYGVNVRANLHPYQQTLSL